MLCKQPRSVFWKMKVRLSRELSVVRHHSLTYNKKNNVSIAARYQLMCGNILTFAMCSLHTPFTPYPALLKSGTILYTLFVQQQSQMPSGPFLRVLNAAAVNVNNITEFQNQLKKYFICLRKELDLSGFKEPSFYYQNANQVEMTVCLWRTPLTCKMLVS